jgi:hypothetical protein
MCLTPMDSVRAIRVTREIPSVLVIRYAFLSEQTDATDPLLRYPSKADLSGKLWW